MNIQRYWDAVVQYATGGWAVHPINGDLTDAHGYLKKHNSFQAFSLASPIPALINDALGSLLLYEGPHGDTQNNGFITQGFL